MSSQLVTLGTKSPPRSLSSVESTAAIDCIIIGYNDSRFDELLQRAAAFQMLSGGYRHLLANSVVFNGKRTKYSDLLNECIQRATGRPSLLNVGQMPNLGACYLASFLRKRGFHAEIINFFNAEKHAFAEMLRNTVRSVAITTTYYFEPAPIREIVDFVRKCNKDVKVIVGGPHVFNLCSDNPEEHQPTLFKEMGADIYVFDSQGELALSRVSAALQEMKPDLSRIPNLIFSTDGWSTFTRTRREIEDNDMDENVVDWSSFDHSLIVPTVQTRTARSCAFKCAFCRYPVIAGGLNLVNLDAVERELDYFQTIGVKYLLFIDDTFNIPEKRFKELCRRMIAKKYDFRWFSYFRCANADDECMDLLAEAGCGGVFLGIESGDQTVLRAMNKGATVKRYLYGVQELNKRNIVTFASFIIGHPGETEQTALNTLRFIDEAQPTFYCLESFFYDPKTPVAAHAEKYGLTGSGYAWRHNGMDWRKAADIVDLGYRTIKNSTVLPLYSFDLWSFAYLMGCGLSQQTLTDFLRGASRIMVKTMEDPMYRSEEDERALIELFDPTWRPLQTSPSGGQPRPAPLMKDQ